MGVVITEQLWVRPEREGGSRDQNPEGEKPVEVAVSMGAVTLG